MTDHNKQANTPVDFLTRFTQSDQFNDVFDEGMGLVEETANYLDGPGRKDARALDRQGSIAYATESMRLTTRLMQLASWLLLQRAVSSGELTHDAALEEKKRIDLSELSDNAEMAGTKQMPEAMQDLISRSMHVHARIVKLDKMIAEKTAPQEDSHNPIARQMDRLNQAFGAAKAK
jgi:regulator of CtrA degradation